MKKLIVANWKLNPDNQKDAVSLFNEVKGGVKNAKAEVVICPPFIYLPLFKGLALGAQNVFFEEKGAFTGEVSPLMLKNLKVKYVIVGHSEVRKYLNETDEEINKKIKECLRDKLKPILCIGETKEEKDTDKKIEVLQRQISEGLRGVTRDQLKNVIIAYEPVWAIGTGDNCSVPETIKSILFIRKVICELYNRDLADNIKILYGGSVKSENSADYLKNGGVQGLLVGGASLIAKEFIKIVESGR